MLRFCESIREEILKKTVFQTVFFKLLSSTFSVFGPNIKVVAIRIKNPKINLPHILKSGWLLQMTMNIVIDNSEEKML